MWIGNSREFPFLCCPSTSPPGLRTNRVRGLTGVDAFTFPLLAAVSSEQRFTESSRSFYRVPVRKMKNFSAEFSRPMDKIELRWFVKENPCPFSFTTGHSTWSKYRVNYTGPPLLLLCHQTGNDPFNLEAMVLLENNAARMREIYREHHAKDSTLSVTCLSSLLPSSTMLRVDLCFLEA